MMTGQFFWIMKNGEPEKVSDDEFGDLVTRNTLVQHVAKTDVDPFFVSTVILPIPIYSWDSGSPEFETMVFNGNSSVHVDRCKTLEEARAMHITTVARLQAGTLELDE